MRKLLLATLFLISCTTPAPSHEDVVQAVKANCGVHATFTPAVDQTIPVIVICVLDPAVSAMLCMTPKEASDRAALSPNTVIPMMIP